MNTKVDNIKIKDFDLSYVKKGSIMKRVAAFAVAASMLFSFSACNGNDKDDDKDSTSSYSQKEDDTKEFDALISKTKNEFQKESMTNIFNFIQEYNGDFADVYEDKKQGIRPALSFEEATALYIAYNDFSKDEIRALFNGDSEFFVSSEEMTQNYKAASLQLMGAYVIETKENPVNLSHLITDEEDLQFYKKYHDLFFKAKYAEGKEQLNYVKQFYDNVRKDFPIEKEVRTEGIMHAGNYSKIESKKLIVAPMIAAAEMLFQNLKKDYTLQNDNSVTEIDFLNDLGLCNYAEEKFDMVEIITLTADIDKKNPKYSDFEKAIRLIMIGREQYNLSDDARELSKLEIFKEAVNGKFKEFINKEENISYSVSQGSYSYTTYDEKTTVTSKPIPEAEKKKIDDEIASENRKAESQAYVDAESNRAKMQKEEDKKAESVREEVKRDEADMQSKISSANEKIDKGETVNEKDFGSHGVKFDSSHSDEHGNLNSSVESITTDSTGDKTNEPLPDPNETGREFDARVSSSNILYEPEYEYTSSVYYYDTSSVVYYDDGDNGIYWEEVVPSNEEIADYYIEYYASYAADSNEGSYQYTR